MKPINLRLKGGRVTECYTFDDGTYFCNDAGQPDIYQFVHTGWPVIRGDHKKPLPHSYEYSLSRGSSYYYQRFRAYSSILQAGTADAQSLPLDDTTSAYNNALGMLVDRVRGGLDVSVDAFQSRQTARMFSAVSQAEDLARGLRRTGIGKLRLIGSLWLQFQYGWLPTLSTVYGIADESLRYVANNLSTYRGKSHTTTSGVDFLNTSGFTVGASCQRKTQVQIAVTVDNSKVLNLSRWTSLNPISIGWELLPYSFVVDWFYDVGNTLRNAETALLYGRAFSHGYKSEFLRRKTTQLPSYMKIYRGQQVWTGNGASNNRSFKREVLSSFPFPSKPKLKFSLGSKQLLNAAGLLSQFLK